MGYLFLVLAIVAEVSATLSLRMASRGSRRWYVPVVVGYVVAFGLLALVLREGIGLGVAYGIWAASGVALTAVAGRVLFAEPLTRTMVAGIAVIVSGVLLIELGSAH
ncbi:multidrug efflux SMR transporter [Modestobacter sp. Leaf380]|uniref:DMT family transporter n=1 Tax=Modestobacter sp. Leaf380 TaxID=1736356 RepID=UPI0006F7AF53|nr:SMR family transporter [Modestobacter sp. Leaf380]KQS66696.1 cation transporter [Modestobacter sp. Leaf380]